MLAASFVLYLDDIKLETIAFNLIQDVAAGGVRVVAAIVYDPIEAFGFQDSLNSKGFSDSADLNKGGKLSGVIGQ